MNGLKYLLPLWLGALTGVTIRCVFAAVAFWLTGCFIKEAAVTRKQRIMLFASGRSGFTDLCSAICWASAKPLRFRAPYSIRCSLYGYFSFPFSFCRESLGNEDSMAVALGFGGAMLCILTQGSDDLARDAFTGNLLCMISSFVFAVYLIVARNCLEKVGRSDNDEIYIWRSLLSSGIIVSSGCRVGCTDVCRSLEGRVALDGVGCTCIYPYFPYLSQLLPGSCRVEVPEDYRCRYLQLSDIGSDHGLSRFLLGPG